MPSARSSQKSISQKKLKLDIDKSVSRGLRRLRLPPADTALVRRGAERSPAALWSYWRVAPSVCRHSEAPPLLRSRTAAGRPGRGGRPPLPGHRGTPSHLQRPPLSAGPASPYGRARREAWRNPAAPQAGPCLSAGLIKHRQNNNNKKPRNKQTNKSPKQEKANLGLNVHCCPCK